MTNMRHTSDKIRNIVKTVNIVMIDDETKSFDKELFCSTTSSKLLVDKPDKANRPYDNQKFVS